MRRLLARVARLYPCAVIPGRARNDLLRTMRDIPVLAVAGSHGAEPHDSTKGRLRHLQGVLLEIKPHGVAS